MTFQEPPPSIDAADMASPPRARGEAVVGAHLRDGRSVLSDLRQQGSLKILMPRTDDAALQAITVNTAGGITGGDRFHLRGHAHAGSTLTLSTQAAERAYRAHPDSVGRMHTTLKADAGARLNWLPQETLIFEASAFERKLEIDLAPDASLLMCEPLVFGRAAMGERADTAILRDRIDIRRAGRPYYLDAMHLGPDLHRHLAATAGGAGALATLVYIAPDAEAHLDTVRDLLGAALGGASLLSDDMLALRLVAPDSFELRQTLVPILNRLSGAPLPRPWMI